MLLLTGHRNALTTKHPFFSAIQRVIKIEMFRYLILSIIATLAIIGNVSADAETLVLLDNLAIKETHSIFFKILQGMYILYAGSTI